MSQSQKDIARIALYVSALGTALSLIISVVSLHYSSVAVRDARTFAFAISCGSAKYTKPDAIKEVLLGADFPTFNANGDAPQTHGPVVACTVFNLSKEPVARLSFVVFASEMNSSGHRPRYRQDVLMEGFFPQSSRTLWLENSLPNKDVHLEIGRLVSYIDPLDGKSRTVTIPSPLAEINLRHALPVPPKNRAGS